MQELKQVLAGCIRMYSSGLLSVSECLMRIDNTIQKATDSISDINKRIRQQNTLYIYGMTELTKAIKANERR